VYSDKKIAFKRVCSEHVLCLLGTSLKNHANFTQVQKKIKGIKLMEGIENENERSLSNIQAYEKRKRILIPFAESIQFSFLFTFKAFHTSRFINLLIFLNSPYMHWLRLYVSTNCMSYQPITIAIEWLLYSLMTISPSFHSYSSSRMTLSHSCARKKEENKKFKT